jgi:hypothetical protein
MTEPPDKVQAQRALKMTLAGVVGQVGCLTILIIAIALVAGLWLDNQFHTRPIFTLVLVLGSVPVTLFLMFRVVLSMAPKIQVSANQAVGAKKIQEEGHEGGERPGNQEAP